MKAMKKALAIIAIAAISGVAVVTGITKRIDVDARQQTEAQTADTPKTEAELANIISLLTDRGPSSEEIEARDISVRKNYMRQQELLDKAKSAMAVIWDDSADTLIGTREQFNTAKISVARLRETPERIEMEEKLEKADAALSAIENAETAAQAQLDSLWNNESGTLYGDRNAYNDAKAVVDALSDLTPSKQAMEDELVQIEAAITAKERKDAEDAATNLVANVNGDRNAYNNAKAAADVLPDDSAVKSDLENQLAAIDQQIAAAEYQALNDTVPALDGRMLSGGRLIIPTLGHSVALESRSAYDQDLQAVTDASDEACDVRANTGWGSLECIADHVNQGFSAIKSAQIGTRAYIYRQSGAVETYECINICQGTNDGSNIIVNGTNEMSWTPGANGDLYMYTCNQDWMHVTVVFWRRIA